MRSGSPVGRTWSSTLPIRRRYSWTSRAGSSRSTWDCSTPPIRRVQPPTTSSATIQAGWSEKDSCALRGVPGEKGVAEDGDAFMGPLCRGRVPGARARPLAGTRTMAS